MKTREKIYSIAAISIMIDQIVKIIIRTKMKLNTSIPLIPNIFNLTYVENKGAAFSILQNTQIFLIIIGLVFLYVIDYYIKKEKKFDKLNIIALGLIIGGIIGNLVDRILLHAVVDYLDFTLINFPIFNIADSCITIGVILFIISIIKEEIDSKKNNKIQVEEETKKEKKGKNKTQEETKKERKGKKKNDNISKKRK